MARQGTLPVQPDHAALREDLLVAEFVSLRAESAQAKQSQQSILQWFLAAFGLLAAAVATLAATSEASDQTGWLIIYLGTALLVPFLTACAFGIWLGEVRRMERVGRYLRARESLFSGLALSQPLASVGAFDSPIGWENLIASTSATRLYGKNLVGSLFSCLLFGGIFVGSIAASVAVAISPSALSLAGQARVALVSAPLVLLLVFVGVFLPQLISVLLKTKVRLPIWVPELTVRSKIDVILPCKDEAAALPWIASRLPPWCRAVVVDNGSSDLSLAVAKTLGLRTLEVDPSAGFGAVVAAGVRATSARLVCVMDCDGSIDPSHLALLAAPILSGHADVVIGQRAFVPGSTRFLHRLAIALRPFAARLLSLKWPPFDTGSVRIFRRAALPKDVVDQLHAGNGWTADFLLTAIEVMGPNRVRQVTLPYLPRIGASKITGTTRGFWSTVGATFEVIRKHVALRRHPLGISRMG